MVSYQQAAAMNVREVADETRNATRTPVPSDEAQAIFTRRLVTATIANTQALLAINETLMRIADRMPRKDTP